MTKYHESRLLPYTSKQVYDLVANVKGYPDFLPWCIASSVQTLKDHEIIARLVIGYSIFHESYTSHLVLQPHREINTSSTSCDGPLRYLKSRWLFKSLSGGCEVQFNVDFTMKSLLIQRIIDRTFKSVLSYIIRSFERQAQLTLSKTLDSI